jgi:UDP-N-acetylglucosamine--N-acetylmuramyl-(pentapeptide) pyrophosphoryl-undecaprenol N-acetylglucosamine transferase
VRIIISGGGTGGHIYPAIAIADELKRRDSKIEILFVGASDRMEMQRVPKAGYKIIGLWISGIQRKRSLKNLVVPIKLLVSLIKAGRIIFSFRPDVVIGVGGYASGPMLRMAALYGKRTLIQEQNSYAGITNRLLAKHVDKICVAYENMERYFPADRIVVTGNPVRNDLQNLDNKKSEAKRFFDWGHNQKTLLMVGGSLGARSLNEAAKENIDLIKSRPDVLFIWQTGSLYFDELKAETALNVSNVKLMPFVERMDLGYALADVIIARAGALTISELGLIGKPAILVPSPNVAEDHQTKNAYALVDKNAAEVVTDENAKRDLFKVALRLLDDENRKLKLIEHVSATAMPDATKLIVDEIEKLMGN